MHPHERAQIRSTAGSRVSVCIRRRKSAMSQHAIESMSNADPAAGSVIVVDVREPDDTPSMPPGDPLPGARRTIEMQVRLLDKNDRQAAENRAILQAARNPRPKFRLFPRIGQDAAAGAHPRCTGRRRALRRAGRRSGD